jgi:glycosyltransferase involved in cell wall biosynthesis
MSSRMMPPLRVLHLLSSTGFHGAEAMTAELVKQQALQGLHVHVVAFNHGDGGNQAVLDAVRPHCHQVIEIGCRGPLDRRALHALNAYVAEHRIQLVHSHKYKTTFYALPGRLLGRYKLVTTFHNWLTHTRALRLYAWLDQHLARFNDAAIAVSTPVAQVLRDHMPAGRVHQIDNGIDVDRFARSLKREEAKVQLGLDPARPVLGFVGRLSAEKGLSYWLTALQEVAAAVPEIQVLIVGEGDERATLERDIPRLGLQQQVRLLGNRRDTPLIYAALDIFVLPSVLEAFPMVVLEALSSACPVIATQVGEVSRIVSRDVGCVVPSRDPSALARAMLAMLRDAPLRHAMGQAGRKQVLERYSSRAMAEQYLRLYQNCLNVER